MSPGRKRSHSPFQPAHHPRNARARPPLGSPPFASVSWPAHTVPLRSTKCIWEESPCPSAMGKQCMHALLSSPRFASTDGRCAPRLVMQLCGLPATGSIGIAADSSTAAAGRWSTRGTSTCCARSLATCRRARAAWAWWAYRRAMQSASRTSSLSSGGCRTAL